MRLVIDTNIVASAVFFGGLPEQLIHLVLDEKITAVVSQAIVEEYEKTLLKLLNKYSPPSNLHFPFSSLVARFDFITTSTQVDVCADPGDNKFIECALDGLCPFIISGDHHLLDIQQYGQIKILKVSEFFTQYPIRGW